MKSLITLIFLFILYLGFSLPQKFNSQKLYNSYPKYKESDIKNKRFKHADLNRKIKNIKKNSLINVESAGRSLDGREIYLLSIGEGKINVLLWSQMHGDRKSVV